MANTIEFGFYGTRGSCPAGDPEFMEFGGNTSSYTLRLGDRLHLLDAGTGVQRALNAELSEDVRRVELDLSHCHLDHVNMGCAGQIYFNTVPEGIQVVSYEGAKAGLEKAFDGEFLWPVNLANIGGLNQIITECRGGETFEHPGYAVTTLRNYHPRGPGKDGDGGSIGFRYDIAIADGLFRVAYVSDMSLRYDGSGKPLPDAEERIARLVDFVKDADLWIADTQFSEDDFAKMPFLKGFGHPTIEEIIGYAARANVKALYGTHHDSKHTDEKLRAKEQHGRDYAKGEGFTGHFQLARQREKIVMPYRLAA